MVTHINHANEIDRELQAAMAQLRLAGVTLLNQSVLMRRINDDADTLVALSNALFDAGILPTLLHPHAGQGTRGSALHGERRRSTHHYAGAAEQSFGLSGAAPDARSGWQTEQNAARPTSNTRLKYAAEAKKRNA